MYLPSACCGLKKVGLFFSKGCVWICVHCLQLLSNDAELKKYIYIYISFKFSIAGQCDILKC